MPKPTLIKSRPRLAGQFGFELFLKVHEDFEANYETFWDRLKYQYVIETGARSLIPDHPCEQPPRAYAPDGSCFLPRRYSRLLRHIQIDIAELRTGNPGWRSGFAPDAVELARTALMPFAKRLRVGLAPAGSRLRVNIHTLTMLASYDGSDITIDREVAAFLPRISDIDLPEPEQDPEAAALALFRYLVALAWPFTQTPWRWTLETPLDARFGEKQDAVLRKCTRMVVHKRIEDDRETAEPARSCFWVKNQGRLVVGWAGQKSRR
ncbi:hypothetical protein TWF696_003066 [Orbilia brochopaga]|uniref:Uncharacterized protein n=1 Tax=Orbilia brochopaga TaxID=3140254 RepID=A0AAV9TZD1_9PEZI